jgi:glutamine synthetase
MQEATGKWLADNGIDEVECLVPDMAGVARGKFVPADKFLHDGLRMPESIFTQGISGGYVDGIFELDRDMVLVADENSFRVVPWTPEATACVIMDPYRHGGELMHIAPRHVLKRVLALYEEQGWRPVVAPEVEFFLVKQNPDPDYPLEAPIGRSGRQEAAGKPFSIDAVNEFDPVFEDVYNYCDVMGIEAGSLSQEAGAGQVEVNFVHGDPVALADQVFLFKRLVREAALKHGVYATFMAKPMQGEPGSSLHLHQSVVDIATGNNIFADDTAEDTPAFRSFVAGLQRSVPEGLLLFGPYVNSYRRFTKYLSAPINVHWARDNRTVGLRVPVSDGPNRRVENRVAGADVNPYLAIATSLACGYLGMIQGLEPSAPIAASAYDLPTEFAVNLVGALGLMENCDPLKAVLGEEFVDVYCRVKRVEYEAYFQVISPWEREFLLLNV